MKTQLQEQEELPDGADGLQKNWNNYDHPSGWVCGPIETVETEGFGLVKFRKITLDAYVLSLNSDLLAGESDLHLILADRFTDCTKPSDFKFQNTRQGGVICNTPSELCHKISNGEVHVRQFHSFLSDTLPSAYLLLRGAAGSPVKIRLTGRLSEFRPTADLAGDPDVQRAVAARAAAGCDLEFDRSNICPLIYIDEVTVCGKAPAIKDLLSFRLPFTRWHFSIGGIAYHRPTDAPPRQPEPIRRIAHPITPTPRTA